MSKMSKAELLDTLEEAQQHLEQACELLDSYVEATNDRNAKAYLVDHLRIMASSGHGFISRDLNIDDLIERVEEREDD